MEDGGCGIKKGKGYEQAGKTYQVFKEGIMHIWIHNRAVFAVLGMVNRNNRFF